MTPSFPSRRSSELEAWRRIGASRPRPRAILSVSAHWYVNATAVTAMPRPKTIHDFFGFPQALFDMQYPAPGLPGLAEEVADVVHPEYVGADHDSWGRSEEHTSELQSLMRISYAVFCLKKKKKTTNTTK